VIVAADGYPYGRVRPGVGAVFTCTDGTGHRLPVRVRVVSLRSAPGICDFPETRTRALAAAQCRMRTDVV
jgi:hypothetical protein